MEDSNLFRTTATRSEFNEMDWTKATQFFQQFHLRNEPIREHQYIL